VELEARLEKTIAEHERAPLLDLLEAADVPGAPVNTVDQVMEDAQVGARGMVEKATHTTLGEIPVVGLPLRFSNMRPGVRRAAPLRGEHTEEILAECGYSPDRIRALRDKKVVL
jgi:crotonobetainyl-CoA:carnitine CoA-transferase CaiB-like acyl-CoA transferase